MREKLTLLQSVRPCELVLTSLLFVVVSAPALSCFDTDIMLRMAENSNVFSRLTNKAFQRP